MSTSSSDPRDRTSSAWSTLLIFAAIAVAIVVTVRYLKVGGDQASGKLHPAVGNPAPAVEFASLTGETLFRSADTKGKVLLINFWGTWCPPCRAEFPRLAAATKPYLSAQDFLFASVCVPASDDELKSDTASDAARFLKQHNATFDAVYDTDAKCFASLLRALNVSDPVVPFTVVIDRNGKFAGVWTGYVAGDEEDVAKAINDALEATADTT